MTELYKDHGLMNQIQNTENGLLDLLSNYATEKTTASTLSNLQGIKKKCMTAMSTVLADGVRGPSFLTLTSKTMLKEQLLTGIIHLF